MWEILILVATVFISWFCLVSYGNELGWTTNTFVSGIKSMLFVITIVVIKAVKALIVSTLFGGFWAALLNLVHIPMNIVQITAVTIGILCFTWLMFKTLREEFNNLRWSLRHATRNQYRKR